MCSKKTRRDKKMNKKSLLLLTISILAFAKSGKYLPSPRQRINNFWLEKDYSKTPYEDRLNYTHAGFKIVEFDMESYNLSEWKDFDDKFSGEDYYYTLIPGNDETVQIFFFILKKYFPLQIFL